LAPGYLEKHFIINHPCGWIRLIGSCHEQNRAELAESFMTLLRPIRRELEVYCRRLYLERARRARRDLTRARQDFLTAIAEFNKAQYGLSEAVGVLPSSR